MNHAALLMKLSWIPFRRSWMVLGLMTVSLAQLFLGVWLCGSLLGELSRTRQYAERARMITLQMKEEKSSLDPIREVLSGTDASIEEWTTEETLTKMEQEEPELVQTVRSIGSEGLQLFPRLVVVRGLVPDEAIEKLRMMTEIGRLDAGPVHHSRLLHFYSHLELEIRIAAVLMLILIFVQLVVFQRIQARDSSEVMGNLLAWGMSPLRSRVPAFFSMLSLSLTAALISTLEWVVFRKWIWRDNAFLGELSLDGSLSFPWTMVAATFVVLAVLSVILVFSGRTAEE